MHIAQAAALALSIEFVLGLRLGRYGTKQKLYTNAEELDERYLFNKILFRYEADSIIESRKFSHQCTP